MNWFGTFTADYYANWYGLTETPVPPIPPTPVALARSGGGYSDAILESARRRDDMERRVDEWPKQRQKIIDREEALLAQDEEDIATIVSLWLNLK